VYVPKKRIAGEAVDSRSEKERIVKGMFQLKSWMFQVKNTYERIAPSWQRFRQT
jgi:hypothetical protein